MDNRAEVREFFLSRRAMINPAEVGLAQSGARRVPGLRRAEVATLAGVSVGYYAKLERGGIASISASVLDAVARALRLDDADRAHLFHLTHAADGIRPRRRPSKQWTPQPSLQWVLDRFTAPAIVRNGRMDLLAANHLGRAMHATLYEATSSEGVPNFVRFTFLHLDAAYDFYPDWDLAADTSVAILHTVTVRDPHDKHLHDLVGELSSRSDEFRRRWGTHNVRCHGAGTATFYHRAVGDLELCYESLDLISDPGLTLTLYAAQPASPTAHALDLLASWTSPTADTSLTR